MVGWAESGNLSLARGGLGSGCWVCAILGSVYGVAIVVIMLSEAWSGGRNLGICLSTTAVSARNVGWLWLYGVSMVLLLWLFCCRPLGRVGGIWESVFRPRRSRLEMLGGCGCTECMCCSSCGYSVAGSLVGWAESGNLSFDRGGLGSNCWVDVGVRSVCVVALVVILF